jgi:5-formyltetrahydrofolate cyclo-ligase
MPDRHTFTKDQLRQESKRIRAALREEACQDASATICCHIQDWGVFQEAEVVLTYMPMRREVDLTPLCARFQKKGWAIPRIRPGGEMVFQVYDPTQLVLHPYGMLEPGPLCPVIPPEAIQLALVPGLAFDLNGWRLGYGGGFYDRFLCSYRGSYAGITYQALLKEDVPHDSHDIPMQFLITETGIKSASN